MTVLLIIGVWLLLVVLLAALNHSWHVNDPEDQVRDEAQAAARLYPLDRERLGL